MEDNFKLIAKVLAVSEIKIFEAAKTEYFVKEIYVEPNSECLCGHNPITNCIVLENIYNGKQIMVGNCCVKTILGTDYNSFFQAINDNRINEAVIQQAYKQKIIRDEREFKFMMQCWRKHTLTQAQHKWFNDVTTRIFNKYRR